MLLCELVSYLLFIDGEDSHYLNLSSRLSYVELHFSFLLGRNVSTQTFCL